MGAREGQRWFNWEFKEEISDSRRGGGSGRAASAGRGHCHGGLSAQRSAAQIGRRASRGLGEADGAGTQCLTAAKRLSGLAARALGELASPPPRTPSPLRSGGRGSRETLGAGAGKLQSLAELAGVFFHRHQMFYSLREPI